MTKVTCEFCGLPFSVRSPKEGSTYYCCSGCALASRIPMNGDNLPVSRGLIMALVLGFGLFNEVLFAVLGGAVIAEGRDDVGLLALRISLVIGMLMLLGGCGLVLSTPPRRWTDLAISVVAVALGAWGFRMSIGADFRVGAWWLVGGNLVVVAWLSRGFLRRSIGRRARTT